MKIKSPRLPAALLFALVLSVPGAVWAKVSYIPLGDANRIAQVDMKTFKVVKLLGPVQTSQGLAITPDGRFLYVTSRLDQVE